MQLLLLLHLLRQELQFLKLLYLTHLLLQGHAPLLVLHASGKAALLLLLLPLLQLLELLELLCLLCLLWLLLLLLLLLQEQLLLYQLLH